jgi:hypothetical protein
MWQVFINQSLNELSLQEVPLWQRPAGISCYLRHGAVVGHDHRGKTGTVKENASLFLLGRWG